MISSENREQMNREILEFNLPTYKEIPDVGLFLKQTAKYISDLMKPLDGVTLTESMISNYVKQKLIANPVRKQYSRDQIAYLIFLAAAKNILSLEDIQLLFRLQAETYSCEKAYEFFRSEFRSMLLYVFGLSDNLPAYSDRNAEEKDLLRCTVTAMAHKVYLDKNFKLIR